jgi:glyoxylase-like metal-dependent hydrolase (beta-lactamase superfamily II)
MPSQNPSSNQSATALKTPRKFLNNIFAFPPNRDTLGATAYFIVENDANLLIDCPAWNDSNEKFLRERGGVTWLFLTHRGSIGKAKEISQALGCQVLIQEQEAYLLPGLEVTSFTKELTLTSNAKVIWTPGHSPGSSCLYYEGDGGVLFSGRHLLPNPQGELMPLRGSKTFHWQRQINSIQLLLASFTPATLSYLCPGANTGFLRGKGIFDRAYERLSQLNLDELRQVEAS